MSGRANEPITIRSSLSAAAKAVRAALTTGEVVQLAAPGRSPNVMLEIIAALGLSPVPADPRTRIAGHDEHLHFNTAGPGPSRKNPSEGWHIDDANDEIYALTGIWPQDRPPDAYTEFLDLSRLHAALSETMLLQGGSVCHAYGDGEAIQYPLSLPDPWSGSLGAPIADVTLCSLTDGAGKTLSGSILEDWVGRTLRSALPHAFRVPWRPDTAILWSNFRYVHRGSPRPSSHRRSLFRVVAR